MYKKFSFWVFVGILIVLVGSSVCAFSSDEDENGNPIYVADGLVRAPFVEIGKLLVLQPSSEPMNPEVGTIYFDSGFKRLRLYDGSGWYNVALEKVSSVSEVQVKEKIKEKSSVETCDSSVECSDWGDCINNYQTMTCITVEEDCSKYTDTETRDCISEFELPAPAAEGSTTVGSESSGEVLEEPVESTEAVEEEDFVVEEGAEEESAVEGSSEEFVEEGGVDEVPEALFDITFDLEETSLSESDKLVVWITLQNFGKKYVPARLVYIVTDESGSEVYREFDEIRVYTDQAVIKRFDNLNLMSGDYNLVFQVEYAGIVEEFSDSFSVSSGFFSSLINWFRQVF